MYITEEMLFNGKTDKGFHNKSSYLLGSRGKSELMNSDNQEPALVWFQTERL